MNARYLLVSNPPHGDVNAVEAAPHFGLSAAEVQMKANYGLPEIWFAEEDEDRLSVRCSELEATGLRTVLVSVDELLEVGPQRPAESFVLTDEGLHAVCDGTEPTIAFDAPTIAVVCRPRNEDEGARLPTRSAASRFSSWKRRAPPLRSPDLDLAGFGSTPFLGLYTTGSDGPLRISIVQEITSFPVLPADLPHGLSTMRNLVSEWESRFEKTYMDHRLVDMRLRGASSVVTGEQLPQPVRSGFSYATEALASLLSSLSPDLRDVGQADLSSRLAYLTDRSLIS
jgi:hypothetical protein